MGWRWCLWIFILSTLVLSCQSIPMVTTLVPKGAESNYTYGQVEPSIAFHPTDSNQIAAASVLTDFYYSKDSGKSWKASTLKSPFGVYGDPVLQFDKHGRLYYFHLSSISKTKHLDRIVCQTTDSVDGLFMEGTFPAPSSGKVQDKHWTTYDPLSDVTYMTWTQFDKYNSKNLDILGQLVIF